MFRKSKWNHAVTSINIHHLSCKGSLVVSGEAMHAASTSRLLWPVATFTHLKTVDKIIENFPAAGEQTRLQLPAKPRTMIFTFVDPHPEE